MPFLLYQHWPNDADSRTFRRVKHVSIGGGRGPIAAHVADECGEEPGCRWHMAEAQLLHHLGVTPGHAVLIDLKPTTTGNVALYRLTDMWGFSYREWTPVCLRLESLFGDAPTTLAYRYNTGIIIAHDIEHAFALIRRNPVGLQIM